MNHIYALVDRCKPEEYRYIGKTNDIDRRLREHVSDSRNPVSHKDRWIRKIVAEGSRIVAVVFEVCDESSWQVLGIDWIVRSRANGRPITNETDGGDGFSGEALAIKNAAMSKPEVRAKLSASALRRFESQEERVKASGVAKVLHSDSNLHSRVVANLILFEATPENIERMRLENIGNKNALGGRGGGFMGKHHERGVKSGISEKMKEIWARRRAEARGLV